MIFYEVMAILKSTPCFIVPDIIIVIAITFLTKDADASKKKL